MTTTHITADHVSAYGNFALLPCFVDGHPAAAIVAVNRQGETFTLTPLFVSVTGAMSLTDHDGQAPAPPA